MNKNKVGVALGLLFGFAHLAWIVLIIFNWAQYLMDKIYAVHMLNNPFDIQSFNFLYAIVLLVITFVVGYIFGYIYAAFWNWMHKRVEVR